MKNFVKRLENEAGLTREQANIAVSIFRDYLVECENDPDLIEALRVKAKQVVNKAEGVAEKMNEKVTNAANKVGEAGDELVDKAKKKAKVVVDKLSEYLDS